MNSIGFQVWVFYQVKVGHAGYMGTGFSQQGGWGGNKRRASNEGLSDWKRTRELPLCTLLAAVKIKNKLYFLLITNLYSPTLTLGFKSDL